MLLAKLSAMLFQCCPTMFAMLFRCCFECRFEYCCIITFIAVLCKRLSMISHVFLEGVQCFGCVSKSSLHLHLLLVFALLLQCRVLLLLPLMLLKSIIFNAAFNAVCDALCNAASLFLWMLLSMLSDCCCMLISRLCQRLSMIVRVCHELNIFNVSTAVFSSFPWFGYDLTTGSAYWLICILIMIFCCLFLVLFHFYAFPVGLYWSSVAF